MSDFNRVILLGRIGNDLELKTSAEGRPYLRLSLATNSIKGGDKKATHWHRVMVFGTQAHLCVTYLKKGSLVLVEGSLENRKFTDQETKKVVNFVSIIAQRIQFVGGRLSVDAEPEDTKAFPESA